MTYRMRNILIAVALAGFAALLVTFYISNYKKSVQHQQATTTVLVAAKDIPQGTLGSQAPLTTREVPRASIVPGAITSPDQIRTLVAIAPIYAGEQVTTRRFGPEVQQGVPGQIVGTQRAVQISGDPNQVLSGTLKAGDHVDFEGVWGVGGPVSRIVVRDLKVLQVQGASSSGKIGSGSTLSAVMLRMTDAQSQKIALIYTQARQSSDAYWTLELRPGLKSQDSPNSFETNFTVLLDGISSASVRAILNASAAAAAVAGGNH
jgi:Flp pilus assembly protein CpaB